MTLRSHRRALAVWSWSASPADTDGAATFTRSARTRPIRRCMRTGALLAAIGLMRLARGEHSRWRAILAGGMLTVAGVTQRSGAGGLLLLPGLLILLSAPFIPASPEPDRTRHSELERELAVYSTPAQRRDLEATLDRYPDSITYELRDMLAGQGVGVMPGERRR